MFTRINVTYKSIMLFLVLENDIKLVQYSRDIYIYIYIIIKPPSMIRVVNGNVVDGNISGIVKLGFLDMCVISKVNELQQVSSMFL